MTEEWLDPAWALLGYGVADTTLLCGLLNRGHSKEERFALASLWGSKLNDHHLFAAVSMASSVVAVANRRTREHGPFYGFGLYERNAE